ncbi:DUF6325 family protein [Actinoplanes palleronii]|uniref:DUF1269 domain-containing protein n=1 Tax=Actinoplanes palleronii TaxID=113570 RepID=A0ABQ4BJU6_9ACTN|nr:DUF6325 family protein [Actinoplanes palleronii]GIE70902.1 hypothetical protein Apa02nite_070100 [Actinoplanes palleronii]
MATPTRDELDVMGPVDYLCVEFPQGTLTGRALPMLLDLVDRRVIRVLDLLFVRKSPDGTVVALDGRELELSGLGAFHGAASGLLGGDDLREAGAILAPGAAAVLLVYENLWAAPLARQLRVSGAQLVAGGRIPVQGLLAALDAAESQDNAVASGR